MSFALVFIGPVLITVAATLLGPATALPPVVLFGLVPLLDQLLAPDVDNTPRAPWLRWLPHTVVPAHIASLAYVLWTVVYGGATVPEQVALVLGAGFSTALAINVAHELMHRADKPSQALAAVMMSTATYTHFCVEHVQGHHKFVGTPRDPATSRRGESLYAYLPRTLIGGLRSAWSIEVVRSGITVHNRILRYSVAQVLLCASIFAWLGPVGLVAFLAQSAVAVIMLETINYIEHYGLSRREVAPGRYERVAPHHSWNSPHLVSNAILLNLARHSDHHAFAARAFPDLRHYDEVPQLPGGYSGMLMLAAVPPLWFRVMDPRVDAATAGRAPAPDGVRA